MSNVAVSLNMAYGDVNFMAEGREKEDCDPGMIVTSTDGQSLDDNDATADDNIIIYEAISCASQPAAELPENCDTNHTECATTSCWNKTTGVIKIDGKFAQL